MAKNDDSIRFVQKMAKGIEDNEKRFVFIHRQIISFEESFDDGPQKIQTIKTLVTWALNEFGVKDDYKGDIRMLDFWKLMGKYSNTVGMDGVLENVHRLGFFKQCPEFYLLWADYLGTKENHEHFNKIKQICEENCKLSPSKTKEIFSPLIKKYFGDEEEEDYYDTEGKTLELIQNLGDESANIRPELTLFHRDDDDNKNSTIDSSNTSSILFNQPKIPQPPPPSPTNIVNKEVQEVMQVEGDKKEVEEGKKEVGGGLFGGGKGTSIFCTGTSSNLSSTYKPLMFEDKDVMMTATAPKTATTSKTKIVHQQPPKLFEKPSMPLQPIIQQQKQPSFNQPSTTKNIRGRIFEDKNVEMSFLDNSDEY